MGRPRDCHTEQRKSEKDKYHMIWLIYGSFFQKKKGTNELIYKTETELQM